MNMNRLKPDGVPVENLDLWLSGVIWDAIKDANEAGLSSAKIYSLLKVITGSNRRAAEPSSFYEDKADHEMIGDLVEILTEGQHWYFEGATKVCKHCNVRVQAGAHVDKMAHDKCPWKLAMEFKTALEARAIQIDRRDR